VAGQLQRCSPCGIADTAANRNARRITPGAVENFRRDVVRDGVDEKLVSYPLGEPQRERSYQFFGRSNGQFFATASRIRRITPLPDPAPKAGHDQRLDTR